MSSPTPLQWLSLVGIIWLQVANGTGSNFPVYSSNLKQLLSISQVQLNNLAFASDAGKLLGWFSGVAAACLPLWLVLTFGAVLGLMGYGVQFLFLVHRIPKLSYWQVFVLTTMGGNATCWINTVCYIICIRNFSSNPRVAVGLSTSYFGLSAMVYTALADAVFHPLSYRKAKVYLLLNAVVPMVVTMLTVAFVREIKSKDQRQSDGGFILIFVIAIATGVFAIFGSMGSVSNGLSSRSNMLGLGCLFVALLIVPWTTNFREFFERGWSGSRSREGKVHHLNVEGVARHRDMEFDNKVVVEEEEEEEEDVEMSVEKQQVGVGKMVKKVEFWLYFFGYMLGATVGLVFLNNLGQIVESRGLSKASSLVSLASSFGFFGRLMLSLLEYLSSKNKYTVSGPALCAILVAPMAGGFFMLLNTSKFSLYMSTIIIGACTGAITTVAVSTTSELFGSKYFGINHNIIVSNIPMGSFVFGYLAALVYQAGGTENGRCMGAKCHEKTFIIWGSLCSVSTLLFAILYIRTRRTLVEN
ncbi:hypothetical protein Taro_024759 [Colocasia esculenta]|uniref:Nodulin-like domain-containing protein n=1 Tax=Colocasia esculenta TaxID=4460 RepID=A0A843V7L2_COLES|nr:hypothetical protein [Colocasia esculenta]